MRNCASGEIAAAKLTKPALRDGNSRGIARER
jgi:hypothetical protein